MGCHREPPPREDGFRMEVKTGYKQTEIGVIPEDWEVKSLGEITGLDVGYAFKSSWFKKDDGITLLRGENVGYGRLDWTDTRRLSEKQAMSFGSYLLQPDDIVIGMDRTFTRSGSKISRVRTTDCPCLLVQRVGKFVPRKCSPRFLWALLSSEKIQASFQLEQKGMDIPHLSRTEILSPLIPFPTTIAEQEAIAEALSDADALIEALEQLITKKRQVKQGAMQELLTGKRRLPGFTKKWEAKRLGDIFEVTAGGDFDPTQASDTQDEHFPYPIYSNTLTNKGLYGFCSYNNHQAGSITVTARGTLGNANYRDHDFTAIGRVIVLKPTQPLDGLFISEFINNRIEFVIESTGVPQLTAPQISKYEILFPEFPEQTAIAEILSDIDAEIAALEAKLAKARQVKQGMMQELLTGRVRLV